MDSGLRDIWRNGSSMDYWYAMRRAGTMLNYDEPLGPVDMRRSTCAQDGCDASLHLSSCSYCVDHEGRRLFWFSQDEPGHLEGNVWSPTFITIASPVNPEFFENIWTTDRIDAMKESAVNGYALMRNKLYCLCMCCHDETTIRAKYRGEMGNFLGPDYQDN